MNRQAWVVGLIVLGAVLGVVCGLFTVRTYNAYGAGLFMGFTILGAILGAILASCLQYRS